MRFGLLVAIAVLALAVPAAADNTWNGGGANGNWSDAANWGNDQLPASPGELIFSGIQQTSTNNNHFATDTVFNGITFSGGAGAFVLAGNGIALGGNVVNSSSSQQTIDLNLGLNGANRIFQMNGANGGITVNGVISGAFRVLTAGTGTLTLTNNNTYTSFTSVASGTTLRGSDSTVYANATNTLKTVFGTNALSLLAGNNSRFEFRANGLNDSSVQTLSWTNGVYNPSGAFTINLDVDRESGTGTNKVINLAASTVTVGTVFNVTGANGYVLRMTGANALTIGGGTASGSVTLNPTTASLQMFGGIKNTGAASGGNPSLKTLILGGTAAGNVITGVISDNGTASVTAVTKSNSSVWTLQGANSYSSGTTITGGTLIVANTSGSGVGTGNITMTDGTLSGTGSLGTSSDAVNIDAPGGRIDPGTVGAVGTLTVNGDVNLGASGGMVIDIAGTAANEYDRVVVNAVAGGDSADGLVTLQSSTLTLNVNGTFLASDIGKQLLVLDKTAAGAIDGQFSAGSAIAAGGLTFAISYAGGIDSNDVVLTIQSVPEPSAAALALLSLGLLRRSRRGRAARTQLSSETVL